MKFRPLTVELQKYQMRRLWPRFKASTNRGRHVRWVGQLQPSAMSDSYRLEIAYTVPHRPIVRVLSPELRLRPEANRLPHVFEDGSLCVHTAPEWRADLLVAQTIVPWASIWLYFYEVWFQTGYWRGEGTHPELPEHTSGDGQAIESHLPDDYTAIFGTTP